MVCSVYSITIRPHFWHCCRRNFENMFRHPGRVGLRPWGESALLLRVPNRREEGGGERRPQRRYKGRKSTWGMGVGVAVGEGVGVGVSVGVGVGVGVEVGVGVGVGCAR